MQKRVVLLLVLAGCAKPAGQIGVPPPPYVSNAPGIPTQSSDDGFEKMGTPQPGEWLHRFQEPGQTFERYLDQCANRRSEKRTTIYLQPLGTLNERYVKTIERMREYSEIFFGVACVVRKALDLPAPTYHKDRRQYDSTRIIGWLANDLPDDALAVAGITDQDLFSGTLNFVFGEGSLAGRRGVYSLCRFERDEEMFLRRGIQLLSHEVGHIFGIEHCIWYKCVMSGANSLEESDRHPVHLCPIDLQKLEWNTGFNRAGRYRALQGFYDRYGLKEEAGWVKARLK